MHDDLEKVVNMLNKKLVGMYNYYGINGMLRELYKLCNYVIRTGYMILKKRSQRNNLNWKVYKKLVVEIYSIAVPKIKVNIWDYSV